MICLWSGMMDLFECKISAFYPYLCDHSEFELRLLIMISLFSTSFFKAYFRSFRFPFFLILLMFVKVMPVCSQGTDSVALFSRAKSSDDHTRLLALEEIQREYYGLFPAKARPYVLQSLALAKKMNDKEAEARACYSISYYYSCRDMTDSAYHYAILGFNISKKINSKPCLSRGYGRLGGIYNVNGDKSKAVEYLQKAIELDSLNKNNLAGYYQTLGVIYGDLGSLEQSVSYYLKALKIREEQNKIIDAAYLYCNLAGLYFQEPKAGEGFHSFDLAIELFKKAKFPKGEAYAYNLLGSNYYTHNDYDQALKYYRKSLSLNSRDTFMSRSEYAFNLTNIGDVWMKLRRFDSAGYYYSRSLKFSLKNNDYLPLACTYLSLGEMNTQLKKYSQAIEFLNKGLEYSRLINYRVQWEEAYSLLSECYEASGNHEKAFFFLKKRNEVRDSIITEKANQAVANMLVKYDSQKKDAQINRLNVDSYQKQRKIRIAILVILVIISMAAVTAYLIWRHYKNKLMPEVRSLEFIRNKIAHEKDEDSRRLRGFDKMLPPELRTSIPVQQEEIEVNQDMKTILEALMQEQKVYLNENLTLAETAQQLKTNTAYLSRFINDYYQVNFSAFINRYRVEEAQKMILDDQYNNFSIEGIARSSGFKSKSTFNQVFKKITGFTPTDFAVRNGKIRH